MKNIAVKNLNKAFGDKQVLKDFSAEFPAEECTCIMGESGCGKTTLLNILLRLENVDSGQILGMPEKVSVVFQENRLVESSTVRNNLRLITEKDPTGILEAMGLGTELDTKVSELSGGMQRRVAIARALLYDSELLIMDEPFKGLDSETLRKTADTVLRSGRTIIMVTHSREEAEMMKAKKLILM